MKVKLINDLEIDGLDSGGWQSYTCVHVIPDDEMKIYTLYFDTIDAESWYDIFLFQKNFFDKEGVFILTPIVAKFVHNQAAYSDCRWCWNNERMLNSKEIHEEFIDFLNNYIEIWKKDYYEE